MYVTDQELENKGYINEVFAMNTDRNSIPDGNLELGNFNYLSGQDLTDGANSNQKSDFIKVISGASYELKTTIAVTPELAYVFKKSDDTIVAGNSATESSIIINIPSDCQYIKVSHGSFSGAPNFDQEYLTLREVINTESPAYDDTLITGRVNSLESQIGDIETALSSILGGA